MPQIHFSQLLITIIGKMHPTCILPLATPPMLRIHGPGTHPERGTGAVKESYGVGETRGYANL